MRLITAIILFVKYLSTENKNKSRTYSNFAVIKLIADSRICRVIHIYSNRLRVNASRELRHHCARSAFTSEITSATWSTSQTLAQIVVRVRIYSRQTCPCCDWTHWGDNYVRDDLTQLVPWWAPNVVSTFSSNAVHVLVGAISFKRNKCVHTYHILLTFS